jgi:protein-tyrosine-phosphatase
MTYEDAVSALEHAAASDPNFGGTPPAAEQAEAPSPTVVAPQGEQNEQVQPEEPAGQPGPADTEPTFFNPDELDPALLPGWKQLQAAFTQKTQQLAEQRRQLEALGSLEELQAASELYSRLSDPDSWVQLHAELTEAMQEYGLSPAEAAQAAAEELYQQGVQQPSGLDLDDPDIAPLAKQLEALQAQQAQQAALLQKIEQERAFAEQMEEAQRQQAAYVVHMQQQVAQLRQANPHYTDSDIETVVKLGTFFNDDLAEAQAALEAYVADRMSRYLEKKKGASAASIQPQSGAGVLSSEERVPSTLQEAEAEALEAIRKLQAAGELDL